MRAFLSIVITSAVVVLGIAFLEGRKQTPPAPAVPVLSLSERINAACPKGYEPTNWEVDGEFTEIPAETVRVTCNSINLDRQPQVVYRSVNR